MVDREDMYAECSVRSGARQGLADSAWIYTMTQDVVLSRLQGEWVQQGLGFSLPDAHICFRSQADATFLVSESLESLVAMITGFDVAMAEIGLQQNIEKMLIACNLPGTSRPQLTYSDIAVQTAFTFVGTRIAKMSLSLSVSLSLSAVSPCD